MYSQSSLSGAATVNQIQFLLQQMTLAIGDTLVIIASQYWGQKKDETNSNILQGLRWQQD